MPKSVLLFIVSVQPVIFSPAWIQSRIDIAHHLVFIAFYLVLNIHCSLDLIVGRLLSARFLCYVFLVMDFLGTISFLFDVYETAICCN